LAWPEQHLKLLCVVDHVEARSSRLRLDRLVFVLERADTEMEQRRPRSGHPDLLKHRHVGTLSEVRVRGPSPASLPPYAGPPITQTSGPHHLELVVRRHGTAQPITPILTIRGEVGEQV
jgi:hypothetical protein